MLSEGSLTCDNVNDKGCFLYYKDNGAGEIFLKSISNNDTVIDGVRSKCHEMAPHLSVLQVREVR